MTTWRQALTTCGTLLASVLTFTAYAGAQMSTPQLKTLHNFQGTPSDGSQPYTGLAIGKGGVLYGTTLSGGPIYAQRRCPQAVELCSP